MDRFEIVPEVRALGSSSLWFDNIMITDLDTAVARQDTTGQNVTPTWNVDTDRDFFQVYPNPTRGRINLKSDQSQRFTYELYSLQGKRLMEGNASPVTHLDLSPMTSGIYLLRVRDVLGNTGSRKIILLQN